ncbi:MAG TPA: cell division protein SepF, partial [Candidatus Egerieimonas faecigallinarum]|nr:cell division protein SepF [Candidatus Egerieimonas faecigallinarum]
MSVLDKFLDAIKLNDDYDDDDEFYDDEIEDDYEEEKP